MKPVAVAIVATVAAVAAVYLATRTARAAVGAAQGAAQAVNPLNPENVFYTGVNSVGGTLVTDPAGPGKNADGSWTLGGFIYDVFHPNAFKL